MGEYYCPACGSHDVEFEEEGRMECLNCGLKGKNFPEEHLLIEGEDDEMEDMPMKKNKKANISSELDEDDEVAEKPAKKAKKASKAKKKVKKTTKGKKRK